MKRAVGGCYLFQKTFLHSKSEEKKLMFFPEHQGSQSDSSECLLAHTQKMLLLLGKWEAKLYPSTLEFTLKLLT